MKIINNCEVCGNNKLDTVLNLGRHPLCDDLIPINDAHECNEFPIEILLCSKCNTAIQKYQPPKEMLFPGRYHYRSRFTVDVLNGMRNLVDECVSLFGNIEEKTVVDIGCNDGSLLNFFKERGAICIGVEPTDAALDVKKCHKVYHEYFTSNTSNKILQEHGAPDFVVFTNVFAHIDNLNNLLEAVGILLKNTTVLIIENHYLGSILQKFQFDTFYHEHPRTYSVGSFIKIAERLDVNIVNLSFPQRYGGNIRVYMQRNKERKIDISSAIAGEKNYFSEFKNMEIFVKTWSSEKRKIILDLVEKYGILPAKAFPGRAAILVRLLQLNESQIEAVYEKTGSNKIGNYVPGTKIPIVDEEILFSSGNLKKPIINFAWHISNEIHEYLKAYGYQGKIIDILSQQDLKQ